MPRNGTPTEGGAEVDFIVVGAGTAGCVLAARLSEDPSCSVALVDHGGVEDDPRIHVPARVFSLAAGPMSWPVPTTPQAAAGEKVVLLAAGTGLGGSGSINAMGWFHGQPADYAAWEANGAEGWGWEQMLAVLRAAEDHELGNSRFHGAGGPLSVTSPRHLHPLALSFIEAGIELGWPHSEDLNGAQRTGVALAHSTIRNGARHSVVDAYLTPALNRPNLVVRPHSHVTCVEMEGTRAVGVRYLAAGAATTESAVNQIAARKGVVLACGAVRTPQLLMLSGIGPAGHLREFGLPVVVDLPGVGQNFHDHPTAVVPFAIKDPSRLRDATYGDPERAYRLARRGPLSSFGQAIAAVAAIPDATDPDALPDLHLGMAMLGADAGLPPAEGPSGVCLVALIAPDSRGSVRLASASALDAPLADPAFLQVAADRVRMRAGVRMAAGLLGSNAMSKDVKVLLPPMAGDEHLDAYIDETLSSYYHYAGTARMGIDDAAVVTPSLQVRGAERLWVADASVMPRTPRGLTQAPTIAIAERAATFISAAG